MSSPIQRRLELLESKSRKKRLKGQRAGVNADINVTPLVDVVLVLLIIFMLVLPKLSITVELPNLLRPDAVKDVKDALNVIVKADGTVALGDSVVNEKNFPESLQREMRNKPFRKVLLSADKNLQFHTIRLLLNNLRDGGVSETYIMGKRIAEEE